jgi:hypothetical protein
LLAPDYRDSADVIVYKDPHFAPTFAVDDSFVDVVSAVRIAPGSIHFRASRADGGAVGVPKSTFLHDR